MRIVALMSWYDESPAMLAAGISSLAPFADHLVALDGAYGLYPDAQPASPGDQATLIRDTCQQHGMAVTIHQPNHPWIGNEVEKRTALFRLAEAFTTNQDWYYIHDADELVTHPHADTRAWLEHTNLDSAEVTYWWHRPHATPTDRPFPSPLREQQGIRKFFRAIPGLHCDKTHYRYRTPDGTFLWNPGAGGKPAEPLDLRDMRVQHRNQERDLYRAQQAATYYPRRDTTRIEQ